MQGLLFGKKDKIRSAVLADMLWAAFTEEEKSGMITRNMKKELSA